MADLNSLNFSQNGFLKVSVGDENNRPSTPSKNILRFNITSKRLEFYNGAKWETDALVRTGLTANEAAPNGYALARAYPHYPSGYYWIQTPRMPNALEMYVDMEYEGGGYDFYPIFGGLRPQNVNETHSGLALGLDLVYPRSKQHWACMYNFVGDVLNESVSSGNFFDTCYAIFRDTGFTGGVQGNGDYDTTGDVMRDPRFYGHGVPDWQVPDGGRWWLCDVVSTEPNGDYDAYNFLDWRGNNDGQSNDGNYNGYEIDFNDGDNTYNLGDTYLVSTNAKP